MIVFIPTTAQTSINICQRKCVRECTFISDWITKWIDGEDKHRLLSPLLMIYPLRIVRFIYVKWVDCCLR